MKKKINKTILFIVILCAVAVVFHSCSKKDSNDNAPIPTCSDGIQNQGEQGVDCGGPCSACPSCSDGIMNQGETGIDCGGPCQACGTCSDGIQNQGETGIDCGGPCSPCPTSARDSAVYNYHTFYLGSVLTSSGWTGNISSCDPGTIPQSAHDLVMKKINYYRRIVGLNYNCTSDTSKYTMCQQAALIMEANNALSHFPPSTWLCYTTGGHTGAGNSNLGLGTHTVNAINGMMADDGAGNESVGHRRWILHSTKTLFSDGSTNNASALWVFIPGTNTQVPEYIAFPPKGYVPRDIIPNRWSFGIPNANFNAATVTMTGPSGPVTLTVNPVQNGYGDNTLVWEPVGVITYSNNDLTYTVTINGITGAPSSSYNYSVIIIKP